MCEMEQVLAALPDGQDLKHLLGTMQVARKLIEKVLVFVGDHYEPEVRERLVGDLRRAYDATKPVEKSFAKLSRPMIGAFYQARGGGFAGSKSSYSLLGESLVVSLADCFVLFAGGFHDPVKSSQWGSTFQIFLDELQRRW